MVTELHFTKLGVPVALILAVAWGLPAPIMEASTPQVGANDPTEVSGGMVAGVPPQEGHFPFNHPLEGQGSQGSYRSVSDYERAALAKSVLIQRRQSDDGFVSTEPIGDPSPSDGSDQSSPSSFSFNNFGDYLVGKNGELSESAENAAKNIANIQNMDDPGEASTADSKMSPSINQKDPDGTSPPKEAQIPPEHIQQNYDREKELQASNIATGNEKPPADGYDDRGQYHTKPNGERYYGEKVPDSFWSSSGTWSTTPRQPLDISPGISRSEQWDNSLKNAAKYLGEHHLLHKTTPEDRLNQAIIQNSGIDGFNRWMGMNGALSPATHMAEGAKKPKGAIGLKDPKN